MSNERENLEILVTFDAGYVGPFKTLAKSLALTNSHFAIRFWFLHDQMDEYLLEDLKVFCQGLGCLWQDISLEEQVFSGSKTTDRYPIAMYYRLLAGDFLPKSLKRVLYLDPDILVINPLDALWQMDLQGQIFAAASHNGILNLSKGVNNVRLKTDHAFFNTGVLLMDLDRMRLEVKQAAIFDLIESKDQELIYPDQDVFNILYGKHSLEIDDTLWNFDPRFYPIYFLRSGGDNDLSWVMDHTAILHFCGRKKPWLDSGYNYFTGLYKHYQKLPLPSQYVQFKEGDGY